jgi:hypothetical protein
MRIEAGWHGWSGALYERTLRVWYEPEIIPAVCQNRNRSYFVWNTRLREVCLCIGQSGALCLLNPRATKIPAGTRRTVREGRSDRERPRERGCLAATRSLG